MSLHLRIAKCLGWSLQDCQSLSLNALRELVKPLSPKLEHEISLAINSGSVVIGSKK